jgi:hypothetical protein
VAAVGRPNRLAPLRAVARQVLGRDDPTRPRQLVDDRPRRFAGVEARRAAYRDALEGSRERGLP